VNLGYRQRVGLLLVFAAGGGLLLLVQLFALQAIQRDDWAALAASQVASWRPVHARRGRILDANGRELARDEAGFDLSVRAAAWLGRLYVCSLCGFHRYYLLEDFDPSDRCPRCRREKDQDDRPVLRFADQRNRSQVARLLGLAPPDLLDRIENRVREAGLAVMKAQEWLSPKLQDSRRKMLWADYGWRSRRIARDVPYEVAREVELHPYRNPAFRIEAVPTRRTPGGSAFVHIVGRVQQVKQDVAPPDGGAEDLTVAEGRSGLEARFEPELRGEPGWVKLQRAPRERERQVLERHRPIPGLDVRLTIAAADQKNAMDALSGVHGAFVVIDAATGAVLALASAPSYEPDDYGRVSARLNEQRKRNRGKWPRHHALKEAACRDFYAPGSVLKPITAVAALTAGIAEPSTSVVCEHYFSNRLGQRLSVMKCNGTHGPQDLRGALVRSCNIYFQTLMRTMIEKELFPHYAATAHRFGLGTRTGLEIEPRRFTDTFGLGSTWAEWILCAIGQGQTQVSPAQLARAYAGLATGALPQLHLVARVGDRPVAVTRTPLGVSAAVLEPIRAALREVPRRGTARGHGLEKWRIACKTGTAERKGGNNAWMAGFAPARAHRPAIAFAMVMLQTHLHGDACGPRLADFFHAFYAEAPE
jgi:cell division protein FtsI/penicillin-binding protein 2